MRKYISVIILFLASNLSHAQTFFKIYSAGNNETGRIFLGVDSGFILLNTVSLGLNSAELLRVNQNGDSLWQKYYPSQIFQFGTGTIHKTLDGNFVTGKTIPDTGINDSIIVYDIDTAGNINFRFGLTDTIDIDVSDIIQTRDSGFLICGSHWDNYGNFDSHSYLIKTDAAGNVQWKKNTSHSTFACDETNRNLTETSDNHYLVLIYSSFCSMTSPGFLTILRVDSLGDIVNSYSDLAYPVGTPRSLVGKNGSYIYLEALDDYNMRYIKFDSTGTMVWQKDRQSYPVNYIAISNSISNGFYMSGVFTPSTYKAVITKFNDAGDSLYSFIYSGTGALEPNYIDQLPDGRLAMIGTQLTPFSGNGNPRQVFFLIADSLGSILSSTIPLSVNDNIDIYPNPVKNVLVISRMNNEIIKSVSVLSLIGQMQYVNYSSGTNEKYFEINTSLLSPGIYFLEIVTDKQKFVRRFVKE